jgi:hypothetical protein
MGLNVVAAEPMLLLHPTHLWLQVEPREKNQSTRAQSA